MELTREEVKEIVSEMLEEYFPDSKVDGGKVDRDQLEFLVNNKIDARNTVDYTFSGTGIEEITHNLGRVPTGFIVLSASLSANIIGDETTWTRQRVQLQSPSAANTVRLLFL